MKSIKGHSMRWLPVLLTSFSPMIALADSNEEKVRALFEIQGIERSWQSSIDEGRIEVNKQAHQMLDQMLTQLNPSKAFKDKLNSAAEKFVSAMQTNRTARDIVNVLVPIYASKF